uniref:Uncharacterized protein n=1 Tax=Rhizophagus irregularis (strain DAOM 181602 / DAOM 197198 / MUCL 43194) TaxID=747089 RepID=U9U940_RHIID
MQGTSGMFIIIIIIYIRINVIHHRDYPVVVKSVVMVVMNLLLIIIEKIMSNF